LLGGEGGLSQFANVLDLLSGGAVSNFSVLAMGVYPYITASIIIQLLTPIVPALEELAREGQTGRDTINRYTYYLAIPMSALQAVGQINIFGTATGAGAGGIIPGFGFDNPLLTATVITTMTAGTMFAIWLGELISEQGIGNGLSLIIFAGIVARVPINFVQMMADEANRLLNASLFVFLTLLTVVVIVVVQEGQRRIPVKYGKRVRGTKMYGGGSSYLPLRVNTAGMIPLIFAQSILTFPAIVANLFTQSQTLWLANFMLSVSTIFGSQGGSNLGLQGVYWGVYFLLVVAFTYFYTDVLIQNQNLPENLQKNGGFIPGIRPGKRTAEFITRVVRRITLVGALFLGGIAVMPGVINIMLRLAGGGATSVSRNLLLISGGGLIIVVGVVLDSLRQLEAQLVMRHRDAFIK
jgi:preprotein translocase subunit SecY